MNMKNILLCAMFVVVLALAALCQGCTVKFKGKDIAFDTYSSVVYEFDGVELTNAKNR